MTYKTENSFPVDIYILRLPRQFIKHMLHFVKGMLGDNYNRLRKPDKKPVAIF